MSFPHSVVLDGTNPVITLPEGTSGALIPLPAEAIARTFQQGDDLILILADGNRIAIADFFALEDPSLILRDPASGDYSEVSLGEDGNIIGQQPRSLSELAEMFNASAAEIAELQGAQAAEASASGTGAASTTATTATGLGVAAASVGVLAAIGAAVSGSDSDTDTSTGTTDSTDSTDTTDTTDAGTTDTGTTDATDSTDTTDSTETGSTETGSTETGSTETGSTETGTTMGTDTSETDSNDAPTGEVAVNGSASEDAVLTADTAALADNDGLPDAADYNYQWQRNTGANGDFENIAGETARTYTLGDDDVDQTVRVQVSYTDGNGTAESVTSDATAVVTNVNDLPTGSVTISGTVSEGETLTAQNTLADNDGLGALSYQWQRSDGSGGFANIGGATQSTYTLDDADVGRTVQVAVSYRDGQGTDESVTSMATNAVTGTNDQPTGSVTISGTVSEGETLTAQNTLADNDGLGALSYQWQRSDGSGGFANIGGATQSTYTLDDADVGRTVQVAVSYRDGQGTDESVTSMATNAVTGTNDQPTGSVTISGTVSEGETLTAQNTLADNDGLGDFSYQWQRSTGANGEFEDIAGETGRTYALGDDDVGQTVRVQVSYTDGQGTPESVTSTATAAVTNTNDAPTGEVTVSGSVTEDAMLTAETGTLADNDGLGDFSYQWQRSTGADGEFENIAGETGRTYALGDDDVGQTVRVQVSYTDDNGTAESVTSTATAAVTNTNDAPTGEVTVSGTVTEGETLTAQNTLADNDGLGDFSYQWQRSTGANGEFEDIAGETGRTYALGDDDVGQTVRVQVSYTDGQGTPESVTSAATTAVTNVNDLPSGAVRISGSVTEDAMLTAETGTLADNDGLGDFSYQWQRSTGADGEFENIAGETGRTYALGDDDVGQTVRVQVSYTDGQGTPESVTSAATTAVTNVNDLPTGSVTISGTVTEGETLTAETGTLADNDGLGALSYQWQRSDDQGNFGNIGGTTQSTYTLGDDDVGQTVRVQVSYTDGQGTPESVTSAATAAVTNVNDLPSGAVRISGSVTEDAMLTAETGTLADNDGLGDFSYQWQRSTGADGEFENIAGETGRTYALGDDDVGQTVRVAVRYTDDNGTAESVTSTATAAVTNTNDAPTGEVTVSGTVTEGETLTAETGTLADNDGLGALSYQWQRSDGSGGFANIAGATQSTYTLDDADVGRTVQVAVSYRDGQGTDESVTSAATTAVTNVNDLPSGAVRISGTVTEDAMLTAETGTLADNDGLGDFSYQWQRGDGSGGFDDIANATARTYTLGDADVDRTVRVQVSYTDDNGTAESVTSTATAAVTNTNDAPTGEVTVSGTVTEGETLTAQNTLADNDGLGDFSYQWQRGDGSGGFDDIANATARTYTLGDADVDRTVRVQVRYTDGNGTAESLTSVATNAVTNVNDQPTGSVAVNGSASEDAVLTADTAALVDNDGLPADAAGYNYQWQRNTGADGDFENIAGATARTYTLGDDDVDQTVRVQVSYTDDNGTAESVASDATAAVTNVNDLPTGAVMISGNVTEDAVLTADVSALRDVDGLPADASGYSYQWQRGDGSGGFDDIANATARTYTLGDADVDRTVRVQVSYTDGQGTSESLTSVASAVVTNVNDQPTGSVAVNGSASEDAVLTADTAALVDNDGLPADASGYSYQWQRGDGSGGFDDIANATARTYTLGDADVGQTVRVQVRYTDGNGTAESVTSAATAVVTNVNDLPTGSVTISGDVREDAVLTADVSALRDVDGLPADTAGYSYQWQRGDGSGGFDDIANATARTYTLGDADVDRTVRVQVRYTDGNGTAETVTSAATAAVTNVNDLPTGAVMISGNVTEDAVLTADVSALRDADGLPAGAADYSYQWQRNTGANGGFENIANATARTYTLGDDDVDQTVRVQVSYTDDNGTAESVASDATAAVTNVNDLPTGAVMISGNVREDAELTADVSALRDVDGLPADAADYSYQWQRNTGADGEFENIAGATARTYTLVDADVDQTVRVQVSYTDGQGTAETVSSAATAAVTNVNDLPTGAVTISAVPVEPGDANTTDTVFGFTIDGQRGNGLGLTANTDAIADEDGLGAFRYQWQRSTDSGGFEDIQNAAGATYTPVDADVNRNLRVHVRYMDGQGTDETLTSAVIGQIAMVGIQRTGDDVLNGDAGADALWGGDGDDRLSGGDGGDILNGGAGADTLDGGAGSDSLQGGAGNDRLDGGTGNDRLTGGDGDDVFRFTPREGSDRITDFGNGTDRLEFTSGLLANLEAVKASAHETEDGDLRIRLLNDNEILTLENTSLDDLTAETVTTLNTLGEDTTTRRSPFHLLFDVDQNGRFVAVGIQISGVDDGNDLDLEGPDGNDVLRGLGGNDRLDGGAGNDSLDGGADDDRLTGGAGNDRFLFTGDEEGDDTITDFEADSDVLVFDEDEWNGEDGNDLQNLINAVSIDDDGNIVIERPGEGGTITLEGDYEANDVANVLTATSVNFDPDASLV